MPRGGSVKGAPRGNARKRKVDLPDQQQETAKSWPESPFVGVIKNPMELGELPRLDGGTARSPFD